MAAGHLGTHHPHAPQEIGVQSYRKTPHPPPHPELGPQTLRVGGDARGGIGSETLGCFAMGISLVHSMLNLEYE